MTARSTTAALAMALTAIPCAASRAEPTGVPPSQLAVTLGGAIPIFNEYTTAGPTLGLRWLTRPPRASSRIRFALELELGYIAINGAMRATAGLATAIRVSPLGWGPYVAIGAGGVGFVEEVQMELTGRTLDSRASGAAVTASAMIGWQLTRRLDLSAGWQQNVIGSSGLDFPGSVIARVGGAL